MTTIFTREALARLVELDDQSPTAFEIGTDPQWTADWHQAIHQARQALAPRVAMPWPEPKAGAPSDPVQAVMDAAMGRDGEPIPRVAAAVICAAADYIDSMIKYTDSEDFAEGLHSAACLLNVIAKQLEKTVNE